MSTRLLPQGIDYQGRQPTRRHPDEQAWADTICVQQRGWPADWPVSVEDVSALDSRPAEETSLPIRRPVSKVARLAAGLVFVGLFMLLVVPVVLWFRWAP